MGLVVTGPISFYPSEKTDLPPAIYVIQSIHDLFNRNRFYFIALQLMRNSVIV